VRRFDEQLVPVEGARRIAGRKHDDHHLPVPRTNQAGKAPSIGPDGGPHHTGARRLRVALAELPFWDEIGGLPPRRVPLPLALGPDGVAGSAVSAFRAFLGRTAADFVIFR
jgi:hypothetical protein